ncbi:MAG TPA: serine protease, partial [Verrucomicrobiae bacterium]|nr:serine protease [Verrucomicrobiae bacterium]
GYFVTCHHVVDSAARIVIRTKHFRFAAEVVKTDKTNDLALLKVTGALPRPATNDTVVLRTLAAQTMKAPNVNRTNLLKVAGKFLPLAVADSSAVKLGQPVSTLGFPNIRVQGLEPKLTRGEINSLTGVKDNPRYFQMNAAVQPGNSGGPLFDRLGNVIGIVALRLNDLTSLRRTGTVPQNVNYAVKSCHLIEFLESIVEVRNNLKILHAEDIGGSTEDWITGAQESVALVQVF